MGISIWLMPDPQARQDLKAVISKLSTKHQSPSFEPHITLLSLPTNPITTSAHPLLFLGIDKESAEGSRGYFPDQPFPITLRRLTMGTSFFKSVLVELDSPATVDDEGIINILEDLTTCAYSWNRQTVDIPPPVYYPHLSLYYGEISMDARSQMIADLKEDKTVVLNGDGTVGVAGLQKGFDVTEVWVVKTEGPVEEWEVLDKLHLS